MSKSLTLIITPEAEDALASIYRYSEDQWGKRKAIAYLAEIEAAFELLCKNPKLGRMHEYAPAQYAFFPVNKHWIVYVSDDRQLSVLTIIHQTMDVNEQLRMIMAKHTLH